MERRKLLKNLSIGAVGVTAISLGWNFRDLVLASKKEQKIKANWGYIGEKGPESWGKLSPEFSSCELGTAQSPINIESPIEAKLNQLEFDYQSSPLRIINNGHTIQVNYQSGSVLKLDGESYELVQFHFHHPSEHKVNDQNFPMELHLVHQNEKGSLAVVGVFLKQGKANKALETIWKALPEKQGKEQIIPNIEINASELLPTDQEFYRYYGSLTTPPCSEKVNWIVYQKPIEVSIAQVQKFSKLFPINARPVQNLNRRFLLSS